MSNLAQNLAQTALSLDQIFTHRQHTKDAIKQVTRSDHNPMLYSVCQDTLRFYPSYEAWVSQNCKIKHKDRVIFYLLVTAVFQLHHYKKISKNQFIHSAAESCRLLRKSSAKHLVYAVLKKISPPSTLPGLAPHLQVNVPFWLFKSIEESVPEQHQKEIFNTWSKKPSIQHFRINKPNTLDSVTQQEAADLGLKPSGVTGCFQAEALSRQQTSLIIEAGWYAQNIVNQVIPSLLPQLGKGAKVLDCCAAPGGKTGALINHQTEIHVTACDKSEDKVAKTRDNLKHYPQTNFLVMDATVPNAKFNQSFDAILVDAPCSALGTIQKHPDVKFIQSKENQPLLSTQQTIILSSVWPYLKPGGYLLYSTCTITKEENDQVIAKHTRNHPEAKVIPLNHPRAEPTLHGIIFYPNMEQDGGYASLLQKSVDRSQ